MSHQPPNQTTAPYPPRPRREFDDLGYRLRDVGLLRRPDAGAPLRVDAGLDAREDFARDALAPPSLPPEPLGFPLLAAPRSPAKAFAYASLAAAESSFSNCRTCLHSSIDAVTSATCLAGTYSVRLLPSTLSVSCQCSDPPRIDMFRDPSRGIPRPRRRFRALAFAAQALLSLF